MSIFGYSLLTRSDAPFRRFVFSMDIISPVPFWGLYDCPGVFLAAFPLIRFTLDLFEVIIFSLHVLWIVLILNWMLPAFSKCFTFLLWYFYFCKTFVIFYVYPIYLLSSFYVWFVIFLFTLYKIFIYVILSFYIVFI